MLENSAGTKRYEFYTVRINDIKDPVGVYVPRVATITLDINKTGAAWKYDNVTVEKGNELYKSLLAKGFKKVNSRSFG